jgi:hypothetical protein
VARPTDHERNARPTSDGWTEIPSADRLPSWPPADAAWSAATKQWYEAQVTSPIASTFLPADVQTLIFAASLHNQFSGSHYKISAQLVHEFTALLDSLLLTPQSRRSAKIRYAVTKETAAKRWETRMS